VTTIIGRMKLPMPSRLLRASLAIAVTLGVAACGGSAASPGTASKTATPATGPSSAASPSPGQGSTAPSPASGDVSTTGDIPDNQVFVAFTPSSGGYAVQGAGCALVASITGDWTNVVGLPVGTLLDCYPSLLA